MKASELRIGNLIEIGDDWGEILELRTVDAIIEYDPPVRMPVQHECWPYMTMSGIPLTAEWLEKFGWGKSDLDEMGFNQHDYWHFYYDYHFRRIRIERGDMETTFPLEYVHQLQNLYFALTGNELEFKER